MTPVGAEVLAAEADGSPVFLVTATEKAESVLYQRYRDSISQT